MTITAVEIMAQTANCRKVSLTAPTFFTKKETVRICPAKRTAQARVRISPAEKPLSPPLAQSRYKPSRHKATLTHSLSGCFFRKMIREIIGTKIT